ncbi:recombinase family protein [Limnohabitans sp.]|uniref:recombinase family protein n=1 Tax=Limnohabitans sp. TaxID=1907725 RepID=UPI00333F5DE6
MRSGKAFNTTTSMGRLTLNILLSFAQFERELAGERVRDKIAASRQRGIWMGGMPPLGYDVSDRKLIPNPEEAKVVREMFTRFAAMPSMATLVRDMRARGVTSKSWTTGKGIERQGKLITKGYVYKVFKNPVYIGMAAYKGQQYPGEHSAIIDQEVWDVVQDLLKAGDKHVKGGCGMRETKTPSMLRGLIFSSEGRAFTPGWTSKGPKQYRYYINTDAIKLGKEACEVRRVPAGEIEGVVVEQLRGVLRAPEILAAAVREVTLSRPDISEADAIQTLQSIDQVWDNLFPAEQACIAKALIERITVNKDGISIKWKSTGMVVKKSWCSARSPKTPLPPKSRRAGGFDRQKTSRLRRRLLRSLLRQRKSHKPSAPLPKLPHRLTPSQHHPPQKAPKSSTSPSSTETPATATNPSWGRTCRARRPWSSKILTSGCSTRSRTLFGSARRC